MSTIGVDIGGSTIVAAVVSHGQIIARADRPTPTRDTPADVVEDLLVEVIDALRADHDVTGVGVGAAGFVDSSRRRVRFAPHLSWRDEPVADRLEQRLALPVVLDNDANASLWGELCFGAATGHGDVVLVTVGTGIGGAILVQGRIHRGAGGMAGEFGHMQVVPDGRPCECGGSGCWEQYCSGRALARFTAEAGHELSGVAVSAAAARGERVAVEAFEHVGQWLGVGLAGVVAALDPGLVVVGGGVSAAGDLLLAPARRTFVERLVGSGHREAPPIVGARLGPLAGVIGAAAMAVHRDPQT